MAFSADGQAWFLINASPDLRAQIEAFRELQPSPNPIRNSPISGVLVTNADLDHILGLFLLREQSSLRLYAPETIFRVLAHSLQLVAILEPMCRVEWQEVPVDRPSALLNKDGKPSGLLFRALPLSTKPPPFASANPSLAGTQSVAYEIIDETTKGRLLVAPDVAAVTSELHDALRNAGAVLFDGTFWSNNEFQSVTGKPRSADDMGHLPIREGSLNVLRELNARHKIYYHINNTNPILRLDSTERADVEKAGVVVGYDGLEFQL